MRKDQILKSLDELAEHIEDGVRDYISENAIVDWLDIGGGHADIKVLEAISLARLYVLNPINNVH